jgi:hypothetical protein
VLPGGDPGAHDSSATGPASKPPWRVRRELEQLLCEWFTLDHTTLHVDHAPDELLTIDGAPS